MGNSENMCESGARSDVAISEIGCSQFAVGWPSGSRTQDPCLAERGQLPGEASQKSPSVYPIVRLRIERRTGNKLRTKLNLSRNASILLRLVEDCRLSAMLDFPNVSTRVVGQLCRRYRLSRTPNFPIFDPRNIWCSLIRHRRAPLLDGAYTIFFCKPFSGGRVCEETSIRWRNQLFSSGQ
jgi:hypothetical protein